MRLASDLQADCSSLQTRIPIGDRLLAEMECRGDDDGGGDGGCTDHHDLRLRRIRHCEAEEEHRSEAKLFHALS